MKQNMKKACHTARRRVHEDIRWKQQVQPGINISHANKSTLTTLAAASSLAVIQGRTVAPPSGYAVHCIGRG